MCKCRPPLGNSSPRVQEGFPLAASTPYSPQWRLGGHRRCRTTGLRTGSQARATRLQGQRVPCLPRCPASFRPRLAPGPSWPSSLCISSRDHRT